MFEQGIEEQLVKEKTGHKSNAVRAYKRTSDQLMKEAEQAVICPESNSDQIVSVPWKEFDIDDDIASFELFCTKKYLKSKCGKFDKCCSNGLCKIFGESAGKKVKKV